MEAVGIELVAVAVLADGAVAADDVAGGVDHHGIVRLCEFHVVGAVAVRAALHDEFPVQALLARFVGRALCLALPQLAVPPHAAGLHPVLLLPSARRRGQFLVEFGVGIAGIVFRQPVCQPSAARQVLKVVGLADLLPLLEGKFLRSGPSEGLCH